MIAPRVIMDQRSYRLAALVLESIPQATEKARRRTLAKLKTYVESQTANIMASALGVPQHVVKSLGRVRESVHGDGSMSIWIGTNDIPVHRLGTVKWTRKMKGARVRRLTYAGSWSWGKGSRTGTAVMRRHNESSRSPIYRVDEPMHDSMTDGIKALLPEISRRYGVIMEREMRYALREVSK